MPSAPKLEAPQGQPLFDVQFRAISESLAGNGVLANTDLEVTDGTNALEIDVASGTVYYIGTEYSYGGASPAATLSSGDGTYDRWDTVAFDTSTTSVVVHEGTAEQYPTPPDISGSELLLAIVYVPSGATDIGSSDILNWRAKFSNEAEEVHYDDGTGVYGVDNVDAALDALQEAAQLSAYPIASADIATDAVGSAEIATDAVDTAEIASNAVTATELDGTYPDGSVANADLANSSVTVAGNAVSLGGSTGVAHADLSSIGTADHHTPPATDTATKSGDGSATTFTLSHSLGATPSAADVQPTSADAAGDFHVSNKTSTDIDVTYASAPASGTDNLTWDVITHP